MATTTEPFTDVSPPAGAVEIHEWHDARDTREASRYFVGTVRRVGDAEILLDGTHYSDGRVERCLTVYGVDTERGMSTEFARKIAAALMQAANELDGLT
jgi:hypothetical protein